jgi:hypothetical protein
MVAAASRYEYARHVGLKVLIDVWNVDPAPLGAEYKGDGICRASGLAGPMPNAM